MTVEQLLQLTGTLIDCRLRHALIGLLNDLTLGLVPQGNSDRPPNGLFSEDMPNRTRHRKTLLGLEAVIEVCLTRLRAI